jgi:hypothetical protein
MLLTGMSNGIAVYLDVLPYRLGVAAFDGMLIGGMIVMHLVDKYLISGDQE